VQRFRFRLETVLGWRRLTLEMEENRLEQLFAERAMLDRQAAELASRAMDAGRFLSRAVLRAEELAAIEPHRRRLAREAERLETLRADCESRIAQQRARVLEAERNLRLIERLKERRRAEWVYLQDREMEAFASEMFLARRRQTG